MHEINKLLAAAQAGDRKAAADLLPLVYDELRKLAAARMAAEAVDHTLDATALVHEAYLRLVDDQKFDGRGHFFAAAAEAMRRILIDHARAKQAEKTLRPHSAGRPRPRSSPGRWLRPRPLDRSRRGTHPIRGDRPDGRRTGETANLRRPLRRSGRRSLRCSSRNRFPTLDLRSGLVDYPSRRWAVKIVLGKLLRLERRQIRIEW